MPLSEAALAAARQLAENQNRRFADLEQRLRDEIDARVDARVAEILSSTSDRAKYEP